MRMGYEAEDGVWSVYDYTRDERLLSDVEAVVDEPVVLLAHFQFEEPVSSYEVYLVRDASEPLPAPQWRVELPLEAAQFSRITLGGGSSVESGSYDEIRFGTEFRAVLGL